MPFFKKPTHTGNFASLTIVAEGCAVRGDVHVESDLQVNGFIDGQILCAGTASLGKSGVMTGAVFCEKLVIHGQMDGEVTARSVHIRNTGKISGKINAAQLIIDHGGCFSGQSELLPVDSDKTLPIQTASSTNLNAQAQESPEER